MSRLPKPFPRVKLVGVMRFLKFQVTLMLWMAGAFIGSAKETEPMAAAVFGDPDVNGDTNFAHEIGRLAESAGYRVEFLAMTGFTNVSLLTTQRFDLLILPNGRRLPVETIDPLLRFLKQGGDLLVLGLPLWDTPLFGFDGRWLSHADYDAALANVRTEEPLFDFGQTDFSNWTRSTNNRRTNARREVAQTTYGPTLHVTIDGMDGWDTLGSPPLERPFPSNHTLTCFRARGGARTGPLMVEWTERDGSRWIATVELAREWKSFALPTSAFHPWTPPPGRGGRGDTLKLEDAVRFTVGVALSHGAAPGAHEYWLADVGTARSPFGSYTPPAQVNLPRLESLSPGYHCFPISAPAVVRPAYEKAPLDAWERSTNTAKLQFETTLPLLGIHPRPSGAGFDQDRPWRWEPLLAAYSERISDRERAGTQAHLPQFLGLIPPADAQKFRGHLGVQVVNVKPPFFGSVWAAFSPAEPSFYRHALVSNAVRQALSRLHRGIYLVEAGTDQSRPDFPTRRNHDLGARIANFSRTRATNLLVQVYRSFEPMFSTYKWAGTAEPGDLIPCRVMNDDLTYPSWKEHVPLLFHLYQADSVQDDAHPVDGIIEPLSSVWDEPPPCIRIEGSGFMYRGARWKPHGVNYMPSSGIGMTGDYFEHWLGRGAYDPWVIQRDLERIKRMGLNAVSVFIYFRDLEAGHLFDFLRRCELLGLKVNLSLRPGTPMDFRWSEMKALIEHYRLATNSTVFAYDLAWEPSHYDHAHQQRHYAGAWRECLAQRHGSPEDAQRHWRLPASLGFAIADFKSIAIPPADWLVQDGPWRRLVADYRLFLDEMVGAKYAEARRLVQSIDPNHPVSFRMQHAGDPTHNSARLLPYDFYGLRNAVDIWEPEAYGRIGDWDRVKAGRFTADYARLCDPGKPLVWAEIGHSVWDMTRMAPSPERMAFTAQYYRDFYRMLIDSGADGVFFWWYPGGFRVNENSDYGIINPDGTDRPITMVIRDEGARFLAAPASPPPDYWIDVDRDRDARGLFGIYEAVQAEYWRAINEGKTPGLRWAKEPGK